MTSLFHKSLLSNNGTFSCKDVVVSRDAHTWMHMASLNITEHGSITATEMGQPKPCVLVAELQSCHVQINGADHPGQKRRLGKPLRHESDAGSTDTPPVLFLRAENNERLYLEVPAQLQFVALLLALLAWQNLRPAGLATKWFAENKAFSRRQPLSDAHELLVCRFKIYGPVPSKAKTVSLVSGPAAPGHFEERAGAGNASPTTGAAPEGLVPEGWFYTMGVLRSNGMLNFITELDGTLLYSIDVTKIFASEIREMHHSICHSPNTLFVGHIKELRANNVVKNTTSATETPLQSLLVKDGRPVASNSRVLIEFPLHIDLEDWFVGLSYFCKREYIGIYDETSVYVRPLETRVVDLEGTLDADATFVSAESSFDAAEHDFSFTGEENIARKSRPVLGDFTRDHLRVSKKVTIDLIEAKFDDLPRGGAATGKLYAEVLMWGYPWARTSIVPHTQNPFWKESFATDLPVLAQMLRIVIKRCTDGKSYSAYDVVVGTVYITPDILTQKLRNASTMMVESSSDNGISVPGHLSVSSNLAAAAAIAPQNNNIVRLSIYDQANLPVGRLLLTVDLKEYFILPSASFRTLESMLLNCPMKELVEYMNETIGTSEIENSSYVLLDIFQSLGIEEEWFKALIEVELVALDQITRKNYLKKASLAQSTNVFNTLFRGSSIFTKSLERYNFRIGQEYLEKVFGNFFERISSEGKDCEIDPRYVRLQEKAKKKAKNPNSTMDSVTDDSDTEDEDSDDHLEEERIEQIIETNFDNLLAYMEAIWDKIYSTSNDIPQQIKNQLKNFRNKVDLLCDPEDKATSLNCMSAFIFLRFFCPAILNPKLFYLTKNHQTGNVQRTLTLIAKVLLNLANRQKFSPHKEAHLVKMNSFLEKHEHEILDYFDRISGRKNDFNEKVLNLSHELKRFDLGLSGHSALQDLPTTPYLIDKNLRLTELVHLLQLGANSRSLRIMLSISSNSISTTLSPELPVYKENQPPPPPPHASNDRRESENYLDGYLPPRENDAYQIGSLEFERSEFLDMAGNNETDGFIKTLCRSNEDIFAFISSSVTLKDLQKESTKLTKRINELILRLQRSETCANLVHDEALWKAFVNDILQRASLNIHRNCIDYFEPNFQESPHPGQKLLLDNSLAILRLKFNPDELSGAGGLAHTTSLASMMRRNSKNPFRRWLKKDG